MIQTRRNIASCLNYGSRIVQFLELSSLPLFGVYKRFNKFVYVVCVCVITFGMADSRDLCY